MENTLTWLDDYLIGIDAVDKQHQFLFELIDKTLKCKEKTELQLALIKLYKYTREHFNDEEALMRDCGYAGYEEHVKQHNILISELNHKSKIALNNLEERNNLDTFLVNWLVIHILEEDINIGDFLNAPFSN
ncbi:hemerythrin family protein [Psychromonas sp.]|nr:hemerythrin family protein [Psychromonas sp.]